MSEASIPPTEGAKTPSPVLTNRPKRVTLQDIAKAAGVNVTTASDALKGTGRVSPSTREKVRRIAAESNYIPNFAARALVTGRTKTVVVCGGSLQESYYANIVHSLETEMAADDYKLMLLHTSREAREMVTATESAAVDGIIAVDKYQLVDAYLASSGRAIPPSVFIGTYSPQGVDCVTIDLSTAVREALSRMMAAGCKRIAYVATSTPMTDSSEVRPHTYLAAMQEAGLTPEIINLRANTEEVTERFKDYVGDNGLPEAVLCQNDDVAMSVYRALMNLGHRVPRDVLLVGCDGLRYMECFETPLSTIIQPIQKVCALAWKFLQNRISNPDLPPQQASVEAHLAVRASLLPPQF